MVVHHHVLLLAKIMHGGYWLLHLRQNFLLAIFRVTFCARVASVFLTILNMATLSYLSNEFAHVDLCIHHRGLESGAAVVVRIHATRFLHFLHSGFLYFSPFSKVQQFGCGLQLPDLAKFALNANWIGDLVEPHAVFV